MSVSLVQAEQHPITSPQVSGWRIAIIAVLICTLATLVLYRDTAAAMLTIWNRSDTYAHCIVVPIISIWLVWRVRAHLKTLTPSPAWGVLLPLAISGFA